MTLISDRLNLSPDGKDALDKIQMENPHFDEYHDAMRDANLIATYNPKNGACIALHPATSVNYIFILPTGLNMGDLCQSIKNYMSERHAMDIVTINAEISFDMHSDLTPYEIESIKKEEY